MSDGVKNAIETLDYLRGLTEASKTRQFPGKTGTVLAAAGSLYGGQALLIWAQWMGYLPGADWLSLTASIGATGGLIATLLVVLRSERNDGFVGGAAARSVSGFLIGAGVATAALAAIFAIAAFRARDWNIWALFPPVMCALQGAAWHAAAVVVRRGWLAAVSAGWLLSGIALALLIGSKVYLLVAGLALVFFMAVPGFHLMRRAGLAA